MDKKWAERLMGKGVKGGDGFRWSFFVLYTRINENKGYTMVIEIISLKKKRINVDEVNIHHPSLEESEPTQEVKKESILEIVEEMKEN